MGTELLHPHHYLSPNPRPRSDPEKRRCCAGASGSSRPLFIGNVTILKRGGGGGGGGSLDEKAKATDEYAGSAFAMSPSPRSLPLPRFCRKDAFVDLSATRGLRRLLRLD
ncbi:uncharacterized protein LOC120265844 [Dioscorea cayenensis subsp. rotundata]|uniref:Uncharacterized protein LOC120265844 n=1 Tax=Dioscorea cayennensis subsp. rotundata TaxID=55577 RepID=A0AB40BQL1_DIOCR|nr:uncharacterized protein LOC120265844 [Dioscorea cayenensis subsp. rotundata]